MMQQNEGKSVEVAKLQSYGVWELDVGTMGYYGRVFRWWCVAFIAVTESANDNWKIFHTSSIPDVFSRVVEK